MDFVCNDINGPTVWKYEAETRRYYRYNMDGSMRYFLDAAEIADPARIESQGKTPQASTVKLWEHKLANADA